jgi:hypothetical protein
MLIVSELLPSENHRSDEMAGSWGFAVLNRQLLVCSTIEGRVVH